MNIGNFLCRIGIHRWLYHPECRPWSMGSISGSETFMCSRCEATCEIGYAEHPHYRKAPPRRKWHPQYAAQQPKEPQP